MTDPEVAGGEAPQADMTGWSVGPFSAAGYTHDVYRRGEGPGVVLIPEMPGAHPGVFALGNHLVDNGFTVAIPSMFGTAGAPPMSVKAVGVMLRGCVAKEFAGFATNADRPAAHYLRALARDLNEKTPGRGVGVIGQCFTGGFALAAAVDDSVLAPILSQPSLPIPLTPRHRRDPGLSEEEMQVIERRAANEGLCALGMRFSEDPLVPAERFTTLKERLGDAFEVIEINSKKGNEHGFTKRAHSVLTLEMRQQEGYPTHDALKRVVEFLTQRLT